MKKVVLLLLFASALFCRLPGYAQEADRFLKEVDRFVTRLEKADSIPAARLDTCQAIFGEYDRQYREVYQTQMSSAQIRDFTECKARYGKAVAQFHVNRVTGKVDSVATDVENAIQRKGAEVSGFLKGWFRRDKKNNSPVVESREPTADDATD